MYIAFISDPRVEKLLPLRFRKYNPSRREKKMVTHRSVSRARWSSLLKRRSPNARATPWPTREEPTSFLLQFKPSHLSSQKKCQQRLSDEESSTGRNLLLVDMNNIVGMRCVPPRCRQSHFLCAQKVFVPRLNLKTFDSRYRGLTR